MLLNILLCTLAAAGLILLGWALGAALLLPIKSREAFMVLTAAGDGSHLEQQCRAFLLLRSAGLLRRPLIIVDNGLTPEGQTIASALKNTYTDICLCTPAQLPEFLHMGDTKLASGEP